MTRRLPKNALISINIIHVKVKICNQSGVVDIIVVDAVGWVRLNVASVKSTNVVDVAVVIVIIHDAYLQIERKGKERKN